MKFELSKSQIEKVKEWQEAIKKVYGKYGKYEYRFSHDGVGVHVKVWSDLAETFLDLTEVDKF